MSGPEVVGYRISLGAVGEPLNNLTPATVTDDDACAALYAPRPWDITGTFPRPTFDRSPTFLNAKL
jgi:hypothetical protein